MESPFIRTEDKEILSQYSDAGKKECFHQLVPFGTAGMRGKMGLGTNRLNKYTISLAAHALAQVIGSGSKVVIAYDTRNNSREFAEVTARALAGSGVKALLFDGYSPVPLMSFAVRHLECDAGVVITASHNTKEYNGFKVYDNTGCQMRPEVTNLMAQIMKETAASLDIDMTPMNHPNIEMIGSDVYQAFMEAVYQAARDARGGLDLAPSVKLGLRIVYTSLHGSGREFVTRGLEHEGFGSVSTVNEQWEYDGDFPTVEKPNPEEKQAFAMAAAQAKKEGADIVIATDPDCDRIGVAVAHKGGLYQLSANKVGGLLLNFICEMRDVAGTTLISSIVTSSLGDEIALASGAKLFKTHPGVKYIGEEMNQLRAGEFLMGYEESCGYILGTHVRDKDAVSAALVICYMAAYYKEQGKTLLDVLDEIQARFGGYLDRQDDLVLEGIEGAEKMTAIMERLRNDGPEAFEDISEIKDYSKGIEGLPKSNSLKFIFGDGSWVAVRPSGTEPKLKFYYCLRGSDENERNKRYEKLSETFTKLSRA
jgi:phosphoglucomutase